MRVDAAAPPLGHSARSPGGDPVCNPSRAQQAPRTVWLSDVHLGLARLPREPAARLPAPTRCEQLYLVGDIVDLEKLAPELLLAREPHGSAADALEEEPRRHARRLHSGQPRRRAARIRRREVRQHRNRARDDPHDARAGRRLLVTHGDQFDAVVRSRSLGVLLGGFACRRLLELNRFVHWLHDLFGRPYWSLAQHVKSRFAPAQALRRAVPDARRSTRRAQRASTASSAATSTTPTSSRSTASSTATTATGSRAARRSSRIRPASYRSFAGARRPPRSRRRRRCRGRSGAALRPHRRARRAPTSA